MKIWGLFTALALLPAAYALDAQDVGEYVILDTQERPTPMQMRFYLKGEQWLMDGRRAPEAWAPVCQGTGDCRLVMATAADIDVWKAVLPEQWQPLRRAYWMFALINGVPQPMMVNRLK